jgi:hypothetical protein
MLAGHYSTRVCNSSIWEAEAEGSQVKGPAWATQQDPVSKHQNF